MQAHEHLGQLTGMGAEQGSRGSPGGEKEAGGGHCVTSAGETGIRSLSLAQHSPLEAGVCSTLSHSTGTAVSLPDCFMNVHFPSPRLGAGVGWGGRHQFGKGFVTDVLHVQGELFLKRLSGFCVREAWAPGGRDGVVLGGQELIKMIMS